MNFAVKLIIFTLLKNILDGRESGVEGQGLFAGSLGGKCNALCPLASSSLLPLILVALPSISSSRGCLDTL